jgi:hypothetical protein
MESPIGNWKDFRYRKDYNNFILETRTNQLLEKQMWIYLGQYQHVYKSVHVFMLNQGSRNPYQHENVYEIWMIFKACLIESADI